MSPSEALTGRRAYSIAPLECAREQPAAKGIRAGLRMASNPDVAILRETPVGCQVSASPSCSAQSAKIASSAHVPSPTTAPRSPSPRQNGRCPTGVVTSNRKITSPAFNTVRFLGYRVMPRVSPFRRRSRPGPMYQVRTPAPAAGRQRGSHPRPFHAVILGESEVSPRMASPSRRS